MTSISTHTRSCPLCQNSNRDVPAGPFSREQWDIITCEKCAFVYLRTVPLNEFLSETLAWEVSWLKEAQRRRKEYPIIDWIDRTTRWRMRILPRVDASDVLIARVSEGPVLDVGCGRGDRFEKVPPGLTPYGIDISKALAAEADARFRTRGGSCIHAPAMDGIATFPDAFFAGALLRSYLEHDADAYGVLRALRTKIRPDGIVVVKVPNYGSFNRLVYGKKWCGFRWPDHVNYFTKDSLRAMAEAAGYTVHFPVMLSLPTDDNMIAILRPSLSAQPKPAT